MNECQLLHPDPTDSLSEEDEDGEDENGEDEDAEMALGSGDQMIGYDVAAAELDRGIGDANGGGDEPAIHGQFDDAEDE